MERQRTPIFFNGTTTYVKEPIIYHTNDRNNFQSFKKGGEKI